jgi:type III pantothenate kinase
MLLAIDIGNTNITLGVWHEGDWLAHWRAQTARERMPDEYAVLLRALFAQRGLHFSDLEGAVLGSVVPTLTGVFEEVCEQTIGKRPLVVAPGTRTGVRVRADNPSEVGADRIINTVAAHRLYGGPAVVVDFGTATTFDVVSAEGDYLGGAIAPGLGIAHDALVQRAARLYRVDLVPPPSAIGRNTVTAMQSGLVLGYIGLIEGLVARIRRELSGQGHVKVIATGGLAEVIARETPVIEIIAPWLTLDGLRLIYELNQ